MESLLIVAVYVVMAKKKTVIKVRAHNTLSKGTVVGLKIEISAKKVMLKKYKYSRFE